MLEFLRPGDELVVTRVRSIGRDTRDVLNIVHECEQRKAFVTLNPSFRPQQLGHVVLNVLGMVAQMDAFIKERQREGIKRAKACTKGANGDWITIKSKLWPLPGNGLGIARVSVVRICRYIRIISE